MILYHFSDSARLPWIIDSDKLRPGTTRVHNLPDPDLLWATTSPQGDRSASFSMDAYRAGVVHLVRFTLSETDFFPWSEVLEHATRWRPEHVNILNASARNMGAAPKFWWCRDGSLPLSRAKAIEARSYTNKIWKAVEPEIEEHWQNGTRWLAVKGMGDALWSQVKAADGRTRYNMARRNI